MDNTQNTNFDLESQKLRLEQEKLKLERFKAWWTGISIMIPLLIAVVTISFGVWTQRQQARNQFEIQAIQARNQLEMQLEQAKALNEIQAQQARNQFEIKAAEIVMNTVNPFQAQHKAKALASLFPDRLPSNFAVSFRPSLYSTHISTKQQKESINQQKESINQQKESINQQKKSIVHVHWSDPPGRMGIPPVARKP